jgi:hypothetical protein
MLVESLVRAYNVYFERDAQHRTILWFDGKGEWEGLLPHLRARLPLLIYQGSLLELRYHLVERPPNERAVVYLPFEKLHLTRRGEAEYMRPFIYTSKVFDDSIESVLRDQGIELPASHAKMRDIRPHLPALAVASLGKGRAFWKGLEPGGRQRPLQPDGLARGPLPPRAWPLAPVTCGPRHPQAVVDAAR